MTTPGGTSATGAADRFTYTLAAPVVSSVSPSTGPTTGGTTVTIAGAGLAGASAVHFGATAATIVSDSAGQLVVTAPTAAAGSVDVTVTTPGGTSATSAADRFSSTLAAPVVAGLSPGIGTGTGGTTVSISGTSLANASSVSFGTTAGTIVSDSASLIVVTAPAGSGMLDVTVTTPGGTSATGSADRFSYAGLASIASVSPAFGPVAGGSVVVIAGANLSGASAVDFGATAGTILGDLANQIVVAAPAGAIGIVDITVTTPGGTTATGPADRFSYLPPAPSVSGVSPGFGPLAGGTTVTIIGSNLGYATAVDFGATAATIVSDSAGQIVVTAPAGSGTLDVTVTTPGGTSATSSADRFTYAGLASITSVSPASGPVAGGSIVVIDGANLGGTIAVDFGATPGTILGDLPNQIVVSAPAGAAGTDDISVTTPGGTSATGASDQFTYLPSLSRLQVATSPALPSTISVDGIPRDNQAVDIAVGPGAHQVCFGPVSGHSPPPCQLVATAVASPTTVTGTFDTPTTYAYNGDGLRASTTQSGITTQQTWDISGSLPLLLAENTGSAATEFIYGPGGVPLEQIQPTGAALFFYRDVQGSTVGVADANGNVVATVTYDPYGNPTATVGSFATPLGYDGQVTDAESGLIYLRARYYDPASGQFLSRDPLVASTGRAFGYAGGNPLNAQDPTGLVTLGVCGGANLMVTSFINVGDAGCVVETLGGKQVGVASSLYMPGGLGESGSLFGGVYVQVSKRPI